MVSNREWRDLDHQVWKLIKAHGLQEKKILVALSGGVDSLALLRVLTKIQNKDLLMACYFHHGEGGNLVYRDQAQNFCQEICAAWGVLFHSLKSVVELHSENALREARYGALQNLSREKQVDIIATGHHREDLLETRLMRLMRGTGAQGLQAILPLKDGVFRPFLGISKADLRLYLEQEKVSALEDPSNSEVDPLRNWIRQEWLPALEAKSKGAVGSMARSFELILQSLDQSHQGDLLRENPEFKSKGLSRSYYLTLGFHEQRRLLAQYLYALGKKDFSQSHLEEIQKRLDNSQKVITFKVAGCYWEINAEQITVES